MSDEERLKSAGWTYVPSVYMWANGPRLLPFLAALADVLATQLEQLRRERDEARKSFRAVAHTVGICHCWDYGCEPGPIEEIVAEVVRLREREGDEMDARFALDEARAKLARIRDVARTRYGNADAAAQGFRRVLRIIDEKEGGQ